MSEANEESLQLTIHGEAFRLRANPKDHKKLLKIAKEVDRRVAELHEKGGALTVARAALMAAFQFLSEKYELAECSEVSENDQAVLNDRLEDMISRIEEGLGE